MVQVRTWYFLAIDGLGQVSTLLTFLLKKEKKEMNFADIMLRKIKPVTKKQTV